MDVLVQIVCECVFVLIVVAADEFATQKIKKNEEQKMVMCLIKERNSGLHWRHCVKSLDDVISESLDNVTIFVHAINS